MRVLVTGSAGYLGEALVRTLPRDGFGVRWPDTAFFLFLDRQLPMPLIFAWIPKERKRCQVAALQKITASPREMEP